MKIQEIITESIIDDEYRQSHIDHAARKAADQKRHRLTEYAGIKLFAEAHCQQYLQEIGGFENAALKLPLYRGMYGLDFDPKTYSKVITVNQEREPTDTPAQMQVLIDDWFQSKCGVRFRKTSLHCSGRIETASSYSPLAGPLVVIPMGEYNYAYSVKYRDLYVSLGKFDYQPQRKGFGMSVSAVHDHYRNKVNEFMNSGDYQINHELSFAIQNGAEIMMSCKKALVIQQRFLRDLITPQ